MRLGRKQNAARSQRCGWVKTHPYISTHKRDFPFIKMCRCGRHTKFIIYYFLFLI